MTDPAPVLSAAEIAARIATLTPPPTLEPQREYRFIRPLSDAAENLIDVFQNSEGRYLFGLREIDLMVRGVGRGELCYVTGFAHSGKTQFVLGSFIYNRDVPVVLFTFDETAELVLTKLVCMRQGWNAEALESRIKNGDSEALAAVRRVAATDFPKLLIVDAPLGFNAMAEALNEAQDFLAQPIGGVVIDYLELIPTDDADPTKKSQALKRWTKEVDVPVICLHQGSRGNAGRGQALTMQSMRYGGEAEANFVLGVRRRRDDDSLDEWERAKHADTVDISVIKNKRPPSRKGEVTYFLESQTGVIRTLDSDDAPIHRGSSVEELRRRRDQLEGQYAMGVPS